MKKQKLAAGLALAMTMVAPMTALAAGQPGWVLKGNDWYYNNRSGEAEQNVWRDNAAKTAKFYLGDDGKMVTNSLVDHDGNMYYVNGDGVQSRNQWRLLETDEDEEARWYYFSEGGKAYEEGWKTINGKKYHFTDYKMDYGFLSEDGDMLDGDEESIWEEAVYYVGDNTTGWRQDNVWLSIDDFDTSEYDRQDIIWLRFGSNGKKIVDKTTSVDNKKYAFDSKGAMVSEWHGSATPSDADYKYYNDSTGAQERGHWFQAIPSEDQNADDFHDDTYRWFYALSNGKTVKDTVKTINGKKYIFDANGIMKTGFVVVDSNNHIVDVLGGGDGDMPSSSEIIGAKSDGTLMYFDRDGAMKSGRFNLELDDDNYTFKFSKTGKALHAASDGYLYNNGILIKANKDDGYKYSIATVDGKDYLVNTSGKIMKAGKYTSDDLKWEVVGDNTNGYTITVGPKDNK